MEIAFAQLKPEDIEVLASGRRENNVELALYMNVRSVWKFLDAAVGPENWQSEFKSVDGKLFCAISIWDPDKNCWVKKENAGTPSDFESVKGEASDAMKRAAFVWGLGRELYTSPKMLVPASAIAGRLCVKKIEYNADKKISCLIIADEKGRNIFSFRESNENKSADAGIADVDVKITTGDHKGKTLGDLCRENALLLFDVAESADPIVAGAAKRLILSDERMKAIWEKRKGGH